MKLFYFKFCLFVWGHFWLVFCPIMLPLCVMFHLVSFHHGCGLFFYSEGGENAFTHAEGLTGTVSNITQWDPPRAGHKTRHHTGRKPRKVGRRHSGIPLVSPPPTRSLRLPPIHTSPILLLMLPRHPSLDQRR